MNQEKESFNNSKSNKYSLIMLHGWGSDAESLRYFSEIFLKNIKINFEVISLNAPYLLSPPHCIDNPNGREWYKLYPDDWAQAEEEVKHLVKRISKIIKNGLPAKRTFLMGFSQGAAMAVEAGCSLDVKGIIGFGAYGHPHWKPPQKFPKLYFSHGINDSCVSIQELYDLIELFDNKKKIFLSKFDGTHEILDSEIIKIAHEINKCL